MTFRYLVLTLGVLLGVLTSQVSFADETCVTSATEFEAKKNEFPVIVQQLPVMLTSDGIFVTAGLKIRAVGMKLKLEGYVWKPGDIYSDDGYLKKVCFDGKNFKVTMENGKTYNVAVQNSRTVTIQGVEFRKSSDAEFAGIVQKIKRAQGGAASQATSTATGSGVR